MPDEIRAAAEVVALRVYPERHHIHMRRCYADAYERGYRDATDREVGSPDPKETPSPSLAWMYAVADRAPQNGSER